MSAPPPALTAPPVARRGVVAHRIGRAAASTARLLAIFVPVFLLGTFLTYLLGHLSGRSPAYLQLGDAASPQAVAAIEHKWGLDRPSLVQYGDWLGSVLHGDLGTSWYNGLSVAHALGQRAAITLSAAGVALVLGIVFGFLLGALAAHFHTRWPDRAITTFTTVISVLPPFIVGIGLVAVFAVGLQILPAAGYVPIQAGLGPWLSHLILPAIALSFDTAADVARQLRNGLVSAYRRIFFVHVLRNGIAPALAVLGLKFPNLLGGAVIIEAIFGLSGYGVYASQAAVRGDVPAVQGVLVVSVVLVVVFNLLVNIVLNRVTPDADRGV